MLIFQFVVAYTDTVLPWATEKGEELSYTAWKLCTHLDITTIGGQVQLKCLCPSHCSGLLHEKSTGIHDHYKRLVWYIKEHVC